MEKRLRMSRPHIFLWRSEVSYHMKAVHFLRNDGGDCSWEYSRQIITGFIAPAGFRPRGRNPRRHSSIPRVIKECVGISMRKHLDLKKLGARGGIG